MGQGKKFGTMGGVYTPSLLTILGVIMYMRLSWVVGNAGTLLSALLIVVLAHTVSVTTGLSLSSIATDKKIKGGGLYYMLSRSLGFPIGGAIGVTLYVATALSISLYLIGFAESALVVLKDWLGIAEITINHLRIAGTIALIFIVTIAYISTSVAIKTQYIILSLIVLSLISVFAGTSVGKGFDYSPVTDASDVGFSTLFGIFFPAVTGFTAGVAMSGDLRDPKKSIPWGTMLAIITGLIVYVSLTLFVYFRIPMAELRNNTNVLVEFSWIPQFVIAGIWGATLSSALGGILGGPRIFQAMSMDSITPRFFAKGVGKNNEPRRALLLTFVLAELGILIGELDVIAGITAMFYMAAYLFINVSCFLEQWASPDFRPIFRIPLLISLVGTVATFLLMIQLDIVAALVSVVVMAFIFLWLTRKQLELGSGDVWQSVWSSVVKLGLKKLSKKETHERNWEPNILLFSGGTSLRPHLLELSKSIAGRNGMISNFDLIENKSATTLFPKAQQSLKVEGDEDGSIFFRRQECKHVYEGIETIAQTYGFSGVEPNTILLGWAHNTKEPSRFTHMTNFLHELDYNVLFLDYDARKGFGKKEQIDIWWQDLSQVNYLTVQLTKFLLASKDWHDAKVRFIYLNDNNAAQHAIRKAMENITRELKDFISIEIVNNEIEAKPFYDVVRVVSLEADLILMNLPELSEKNESSFILETNALLKELGTTLLMRASSQFNKGKIVNLDIEKEYNTAYETADNATKLELQTLANSTYVPLQDAVAQVDESMQKANHEFVATVYKPIQKIFTVLENHIVSKEKLDTDFYEDIQAILSDIQNNRLGNSATVMKQAVSQYDKQLKQAIYKLKPLLKRTVSREELEQNKEDSLRLQSVKSRLRSRRKSTRVKIRLRKTAQELYDKYYEPCFVEHLYAIGTLFYELNFVTKRWLNEWEAEQTKESEAEFLQEAGVILRDLIEANRKQLAKDLGQLSRMFANSLLAETDKLLDVKDTFYLLEDQLPVKGDFNKDTYPENWRQNTDRLLNQLKVNFELTRLKQKLLIKLSDVYPHLHSEYLSRLLRIVGNLQTVEKEKIVQVEEIEGLESELMILGYEIRKEQVIVQIEGLIDELVQKLPEKMEVIGVKDLSSFDYRQIDLESEYIDIERVVAYLVDSNVIHNLDKLLQQHFSEVQSEQFKVENTIKLLQFGTATSTVGKVSNTKEISQKIQQELEEVIQRLEIAAERLERGVQRIRSRANELLTDEVIWSRAKQLNGIIRQEKRRRGISKYAEKVKHFPKKVYHKADNLLVKGKDMVLQSSFQQRFRELENPHAKWRNFMTTVSISKENRAEIPFYYQQLFMGKHKAPAMPLRDRYAELERFSKAYEYFEQGTSGAVLLTGEYYSGTSFLIENIINTHNFPQVLRLPAPKFLYSDTSKTVEHSFRTATGSVESWEDYMKKLKRGTLIVIEDLELWWYRTEKGTEQIEYVCELIRNYGQKFLFVLSCNTEFFKLIRKISSIESCLQDTIAIQPLRIEQMKDAILERHRASGITLVWKGVEEKELSPKMTNEILRKITGITQGNVGFAFYLWLSSIEKMEDGKIILNDFISKQLPEVDKPEWATMLYQFVLHKQVRKRNLFAVYKDTDRAEVEACLESLLRTGIVVMTDSRVFQINPFAMMYVLKYLRTKNFID